MLKVFAFLTKLPELSDAEFSAHWRHPHGTLTRKIPQIRQYAQNHAIGAVPGVERAGATGVATIWVDDAAALGAMADHPDYPPLDADGDNMYVRSDLSWLVGEPVRSVAGTEPVGAKALLFLCPVADTSLEGETLDRLAAAAASLDGVMEVNTTIAADPATALYAAVLELSFADDATFRAAWNADGPAVVAAVAAVADLGRSRGLLAREERVIWPATAEA